MLKITPKDCPKILEGDIGGENPCYVYIPSHKNYVIASFSIEDLLNLKEIRDALEISEEGISFFYNQVLYHLLRLYLKTFLY